MITTEEVMNTLYKAHTSIVEDFAEALLEATTADNQMLDGERLDKIFSFGMLLTHCDKCREDHWFVCFAKLGTPLEAAVPKGEMKALTHVLSFEDAVRMYKDLNNNEIKH